MQNNRTFHARSFFLISSALAALVLAGCSTPSVTNMTAPSLTPNASNIYVITARIKPRASNVVPDSVAAKLIIDGNAHKMTKVPQLANVYEYEFNAPAGVTELRYYFLVEYQVSNVGVLRPRIDYSPLQVATIVGRDAPGLSAGVQQDVSGVHAAEPAPVAILGTAPLSAAPEASATAQQTGDLTVSPAEIKIRQSQTTTLMFMVPQKVTGSPMLIDVTTDIPKSVIMPEVFVHPRSNVGSVTIEGGEPGSGHLYAKMPGSDKPIVIPVTVQPLN